MKTIQTKSGELLLVKIDSQLYFIFDNIEARIMSFLGKFDYQRVGRFLELEDKDFEEFVDYYQLPIGVYRNYIGGLDDAWNCGNSAKESFQSLCKSQGIEDDLNNYLIIKKI